MFDFSEFFLEKMDFRGKKMLTFLKNEIIFKYFKSFLKMKLRYRPGGLRPRTPCGGRVIAFKWPGRPLPKKILGTPLKEKEFIYLCMYSVCVDFMIFMHAFRHAYIYLNMRVNASSRFKRTITA